MFKNNCRFYDFYPASQASHYHPFCFGRLMYFRQTFFCTAAGSHFWSLDLPVRHWKGIGTIQCRRGNVNTNTSISRYKALNLTSSLPWGCWTVKVIGYAMLEAQFTQKQCFLFKSEGILPVQTFISAQGEFFEMIESSRRVYASMYDYSH